MASPTQTPDPALGVAHGAGLYVGALIGPGLLLVPALAAQTAGPASIVAWLLLIALSAPLAATFGALAVRFPVSDGVAAYVRAGLGDSTAAVTGGWFVMTTIIGPAALALMGGFYVADLTSTGDSTAYAVASATLVGVVGANALGLRVSASMQLILSTLLVAVLAAALLVALPQSTNRSWAPFAPHGWMAVGTAANILIWLFVGWEAVAQLAGDFRQPSVDLPRAMAIAFAVVTVLYLAIAIATISIPAAATSRVPLADLVGVGFGKTGRMVTAVLAVALTAGTMNVYIAGSAKLVSTLAARGELPAWLRGTGVHSVPLPPLGLFLITGLVILSALIAGVGGVADLVRATSGLFVGIYLLAVVSAIRTLDGWQRMAAGAASVMVGLVALFSGWYALVPALSAVAMLGLRHYLRWRSTIRASSETASSTADS